MAGKPKEQRLGHSKGDHEPAVIGRPIHLQRRNKGIAIPQASPRWHNTAQSWFRSLALSAQSDLFEPSDWATAVAAAEMYDRFLRTDNASILQSFVRLSERLMSTEADRRRVRVELVEGVPVDADDNEAGAGVSKWDGKLRSVG